MSTIKPLQFGGGAVSTVNGGRGVIFKQASIRQGASEIEEREAQSYALGDTALLDIVRSERKGVTLDENQLGAIDMLVQNQFACLAGYAGTGKTTIMKQALEKFSQFSRTIDWGAFRTAGERPDQNKRPAIALCCFTNVAARNLASKLPEEWAAHCMSIHSMLCYRPVRQGHLNANGNEVTLFEPAYNAQNRVPLDAIFIDEAGIVSRTLWQAIMEAIGPSTRIYLLGDLAQLPAIQGVSPMPFAMKAWPTVELTKIYRQEGDSEIVPNLTRIRKGLFPVHHDNDFRCGPMETLPKGAQAAQGYIKNYIGALFARGIWNPMRDIILTPLNNGPLGQDHWNTQFRFFFNPVRKDGNGKAINPIILIQTAVGPIHLSLGDKVMATDNGGRTATEIRFNNGSIGIITAITPNPEFKGVSFDFSDDGLVDMDLFSMTQALDDQTSAVAEAALDLDDADDDVKRRAASHIVTVKELATGDLYHLSRSAEVGTLQHAYAATTHKFQGSQAQNVLVICHTSMPFGLNRETIYTGCSRGQKKVFLLHDTDGLTRAVTNAMLKGSNTQEKVDRLIEHYKKNKGWAVPTIPEAKVLA
jgi:ATP-dependent exoDNAse (exonuclease V) alpha subunit